MRRLATIVVIAACGLALGCGEEESVPDAEIVQALELEKSSASAAYRIGGDPFCEVSEDLLNNPSEVEDARSADGKVDLVITDSEETVGVQGIPPFDKRCESDARRALDRLAEE
jgi:hypothetical protein